MFNFIKVYAVKLSYVPRLWNPAREMVVLTEEGVLERMGEDPWLEEQSLQSIIDI